MLYRLCKKDPIEFWKYTPAETNLMIEIGTDELNGNISRDADFKATIYNAPYGPYLKKGEYYPFKISNFLNKNNLPKNGTKKQKELSNEERIQQERERSKHLRSYSQEMKEELRAIERMR